MAEGTMGVSVSWFRLVGWCAGLSWLFLATAAPAATAADAAKVPSLDHVIVVIMENKNLDQVARAPYVSSLVTNGASFSAYHAIAHPSQPNYLALWSGSTQGVTSNECPLRGVPWSRENLGHLCERAGITWRAYCEDLPTAGSAACQSSVGEYARKHAPWTNFDNLDHSNERPYTDLARDIAAGRLPSLAFVIPNNNNNTHNRRVPYGDAWLAGNLPAMIDAVGPHGVVLLTWDENDHGPTNQILTVAAGGAVKAGFVSAREVNHFTLLRTICDALALSPPGLAAREAPITDIWKEPVVTPDDSSKRSSQP
jgi:acid phosphatase